MSVMGSSPVTYPPPPKKPCQYPIIIKGGTSETLREHKLCSPKGQGFESRTLICNLLPPIVTSCKMIQLFLSSLLLRRLACDNSLELVLEK